MTDAMKSGSVVSIAQELRSTLIGSCTDTDLEMARALAARLVTQAMRQDLDREALMVKQALGLRHLRGGKILMLLINRAGSLCSASDIASALETVSSGTIKVYMSELRNALTHVGLGDLIQTEWRKGYWISRAEADGFCTWLQSVSKRSDMDGRGEDRSVLSPSAADRRASAEPPAH